MTLKNIYGFNTLDRLIRFTAADVMAWLFPGGPGTTTDLNARDLTSNRDLHVGNAFSVLSGTGVTHAQQLSVFGSPNGGRAQVEVQTVDGFQTTALQNWRDHDGDVVCSVMPGGFAGRAAGLTGLDASQLALGTVPTARLDFGLISLLSALALSPQNRLGRAWLGDPVNLVLPIPGYSWQDANGTVPAHVGDPLRRIDPLFGGAPLLAPDDASRPTLGFDTALGLYFIRTNGTSTFMGSAHTLNVPWEMAVAGVYRGAVPGGFVTPNNAWLDGFGTEFSAFIAPNGPSGTQQELYVYVNEPVLLPLAPPQPGVPAVVGLSNDGSTILAYRDWCQATTPGGSLAGNPGGVSIGRSAAGALYGQNDYYAVATWAGRQSVPVRTRLKTALGSAGGVPPASDSDPVVVTGADAGTSQGYAVTFPANYVPGTLVDVVLYGHGAGENARSLTNTEVFKKYSLLHVSRRVRPTVIVGVDLGGSSNWGNDAALALLKSGYDYVVAHFALNVARTHFWAQSMGGVVMLRAVAARTTWGGVQCVYVVDGVCSLDSMDAAGAGFYSPAIRTAWGGGPSTWAGKQPTDIDPVDYADLRFVFVVSDADTVVPAVSNGRAMATRVTGHARSVSVQVATGDHGDPSQFTDTLGAVQAALYDAYDLV